MNINEKDFIYETFLIGEFPFTLIIRVTDYNTNLYAECSAFNDNFRDVLYIAKNRLIKKLEDLNNE